ncbi:AAA family ATPase [Acidovorax delafieldii]|jgi:hypothetical protein|uniref:AAA family ATPase n=1 Tax=Acidovorax delafieldii TaxID=47920 RepID=UPI003757E4E3
MERYAGKTLKNASRSAGRQTANRPLHLRQQDKDACMNLSRMSVENYRAFNEPATLSMAPLTLIFGQNNAGKSSLARLLPSIANSCSVNERFSFIPVTTSDWETNGRDFLYGNGKSPTLRLKLWFQQPPDIQYKATYEISLLADREVSFVSNLIIELGDRILAELIWSAEDISKSHPHRNRYRMKSSDGEQDAIIEFDGLVPRHQGETSACKLALDNLALALDTFADRVHWLGPLRHIPDRIERRAFRGVVLNSTGKQATQVLAASWKSKSPLFGRVSGWFEQALGQCLVCIDGAFDGDELFSIALSPTPTSSIRVPIADSGAGIAQVLPIIVLGMLALEGALGEAPILVFENPELHLHDSLHDDIGRFLAQVSTAACNPIVIAETHSENVLLAIELAVAKKEIDSDKVAINWVRATHEGSAVEAVSLDGTGTPSSQWPREAFETASNQAKKLFILRQGSSGR